MGRFLGEDPLGFSAGDPNLNRIVGNHPTMATDPSGRIEQSELEKYIPLFGEEAATAYQAFKDAGGTVAFHSPRYPGLWGRSDIDNYATPHIQISNSLSPPEAAHELLTVIANQGLGYSSVRAKMPLRTYRKDFVEKDLDAYQRSLQIGLRLATEDSARLAELYYKGVGIVSDPADGVISIHDLIVERDPWAILGLLPLVPSGAWSKAGQATLKPFKGMTLHAPTEFMQKLSSLSTDQISTLRQRLDNITESDQAAKIINDFVQGEESAGRLAPIRVVGRREITNSVSTLGKGYRHLDEFAPRSAFSGVYDPQKKNLLAYPSSRNPNDLPREAVLKDGTVTAENVVARNGGHAEVNEVLSKLNGHSSPSDRNVGFTLFSTEEGGIRVEWFSQSVNGRNPTFKGDFVPKYLRSEIKRELKKLFPDRNIFD